MVIRFEVWTKLEEKLERNEWGNEFKNQRRRFLLGPNNVNIWQERKRVIRTSGRSWRRRGSGRLRLAMAERGSQSPAPAPPSLHPYQYDDEYDLRRCDDVHDNKKRQAAREGGVTLWRCWKTDEKVVYLDANDLIWWSCGRTVAVAVCW